MLEPASHEKAALQIAAIPGRRLWRLKSWNSEYTMGGNLGSARALCLGPGEWLIVADVPGTPEVPEDGHVLVELTDGLAGIEVSGSAAREVLSKGCGLDLHPRSFPAGQCARTRFAQIPLIVDCRAEPPRFELYVARSYSHYLYSWLADAAAEWGDSLT